MDAPPHPQPFNIQLTAWQTRLHVSRFSLIVGLPLVSKAQMFFTHTSDVGHVSSTFFSIFIPPTVAIQLFGGGPFFFCFRKWSKFNQFHCDVFGRKAEKKENLIKLTTFVFIAANFVGCRLRLLHRVESFSALCGLIWTERLIANQLGFWTTSQRIHYLAITRLSCWEFL